MQNGTYTIYCIENRIVAESPWLELDKPLKQILKDSWSLCGENFTISLNPHIGTGNNWRPKHPKANEEWHNTRRAAGVQGWYDLKFAARALRQIRKDDALGIYNYVDGYGTVHQIIRREYRISKAVVTYDFSLAPANAEDFVKWH